jgi:MFS family permease
MQNPNSSVSPLSQKAMTVWKVGTLSYTTFGLVALFCWLLWGDFSWALSDRAVPTVVQFLLKKFEASDTFTGFMIGSLPYIVAIVIGPVISYASDRHRGPWGRRIPFLVAVIPVAVGALLGLAFSPELGAKLHNFLQPWNLSLNFSISLSFGLFWTIFAFCSYSANIVFLALINDVVPSRFLGRFFGLFRALSLTAGIIFNCSLIGHSANHYKLIFLGMALVYGVGFALMCSKVKEGKYPPPADVMPGRRGTLLNALKVYFRECYTDPYYLWYFVMMAFSWMAFIPINLFSMYYAISLNISLVSYGKYIAITFAISLALTYIMGILADRLHPLRMAWITMSLYALAMLGGGLFADRPSSFAVAFVAHGVLSGTWATSTASIGLRLLPKNKYAQYASAESVVSSIGRMLIGMASGIFLDGVNHQYRYTFFMGLVISIMSVLASLVLYRKFLQMGGPAHYVAPEKVVSIP